MIHSLLLLAQKRLQWCVFGHALAQWADALLAHRGAPALSRRLLTHPSILKVGHRLVTAFSLPVHMHPLPLAPVFARSALPRKRVRSLALSGPIEASSRMSALRGEADVV